VNSFIIGTAVINTHTQACPHDELAGSASRIVGEGERATTLSSQTTGQRSRLLYSMIHIEGPRTTMVKPGRVTQA